jgi:hypothetical protein
MGKLKLLFLDTPPTFIVENVPNFYLLVVLVSSQIWQGPFLDIVILPTSPNKKILVLDMGKNS